MKAVFKFLTLAVLTLSLNSCGLPGALVRSAGRLVQGADSMVGQAMTTGI